MIKCVTRFNCWLKKDKSWMTLDEPVQMVLPNNRHSVTIFGAMGR